MHKLGVSGVLTNADGLVLLIRTAHAGWELPGGGVEPGEDLIAALQRETNGETGCAAPPGRIVAVHLHVARALVHVILNGTASGDPSAHPEQESLDAGWFSPQEALDRVTHPTERDCLQHGLSPAPEVGYCVF